MQSKRQLFEGQTNHPLSEEEKQAFWKKISFSGRLLSFGDERKMRRGLEAMMEIPTGREQIRQIINSPQKEYKIDTGYSTNRMLNRLDSLGGAPTDTANQVYINSKILKSPSLTGNILLHELLHNRQLKRSPQGTKRDKSNVFADAETQALSSQLTLETNESSRKDISYMESYNQNCKKWKSIVNGEKNKPEWAPPLKYTPNLTIEEKKEANQMYIEQMASLETRAQYIQDFYLSEQQQKKGNFSSPSFSYFNSLNQTAYEQQSASHYLETQEDILDAKKRNPALNERIMLQSLQDRRKSQEFENETKVNEKIYALENGLTKENYDKRVLKITDMASNRLDFVHKIADSDQFTPSEKVQLIKGSIIKDKNESPKRNQNRDEMIKTLRKVTGRPMPFVLTTPQQDIQKTSNSPQILEPENHVLSSQSTHTTLVQNEETQKNTIASTSKTSTFSTNSQVIDQSDQTTLSSEKNLIAQNNETKTPPSPNSAGLRSTLKSAQEKPYTDTENSSVLDTYVHSQQRMA